VHQLGLRRHALAITVGVLGALFFAAFTWSEYGYFCDQARDHGSRTCEGFWSSEHLHDWVYNATSNYQSELLFGVLVVVLLHRLAGREDEDET
jgi:hypothetical protein